MAELYDDDDFYGAGCEMDDQLLIVNDSGRVYNFNNDNPFYVFSN